MNQSKAIAAIVGVGLLLIPNVGRADIRVNEIAWMGTSLSSSDEWIEIANDGDTVESIDGWTLSWDTDTASPKTILFAGSLAAGDYLLLERTNDDTIPAIPADSIYTGALDNAGEDVILRDASGAERHRIDAKSGGWLAGDNGSKETMQWAGGGWTTAPGTPRAANQSSVGTMSNETEASFSESPPTTPVSAHSSPVAESRGNDTDAPSVNIGRNRRVSVGEPVRFEARGIPVGEGFFYEWSFGDGAAARGRETSHTYSFPGEYHVVMNAEKNEASAVARSVVSVFEPNISIRRIRVSDNRDAVVLVNDLPFEHNVGGWRIRVGGAESALPRDTIIGARGRIALAPNLIVVPVDDADRIELLRPDGVRAAFTVREFEVNEKEPADSGDLSALRDGLSTAFERLSLITEGLSVHGISVAIKEPPAEDADTSERANETAKVQIAQASIVPVIGPARDASNASVTVTETPIPTVIVKRDSGIVGIMGRISRFFRALLPGS